MKKYYFLVKCIGMWGAIFYLLLLTLHFAAPLLGWTQMERLFLSVLKFLFLPFLLLGVAELFLWFRLRFKGERPVEPQYIQSSYKLTAAASIAIMITGLLIGWLRIRAEI